MSDMREPYAHIRDAIENMKTQQRQFREKIIELNAKAESLSACIAMFEYALSAQIKQDDENNHDDQS